MTTYKAIVTLKNGAHRILRMTRDRVAKIVTEFRKMQRSIFNDVVSVQVGNEMLTLNDVASIKFMNEYTRQEFLTIA